MGAIVGIGIDVVDVARFATALERTPRLVDRLFTEVEQPLPLASLAARFAAKEAVAKALGAPAGLRWLDAELPPTNGSAPVLRVRGSVAARVAELGIVSWHLSMTHDAGIASAVAVAERVERTDVVPIFSGRRS